MSQALALFDPVELLYLHALLCASAFEAPELLLEVLTCMLQFQWAAHQSANQRFADVVLRNYSAGDVVWVQDYHLMLLPAMLKNRAPKMKVGRGNLLRHLCILRCVAAPDQEREQLNLQCLDSTCVGPGLPPHAPPSQAQEQSTKDEGGQLGIRFLRWASCAS